LSDGMFLSIPTWLLGALSSLFFVADLFFKMHSPWPLRPSVHHYCFTDIALLPPMPSDGGHWSTLHFWKFSCSPGNFWVLSLYLSFIGDNSLCVKIFDFGLHYGLWSDNHTLVGM
jgi:hypothetical protein